MFIVLTTCALCGWCFCLRRGKLLFDFFSFFFFLLFIFFSFFSLAGVVFLFKDMMEKSVWDEKDKMGWWGAGWEGDDVM